MRNASEHHMTHVATAIGLGIVSAFVMVSFPGIGAYVNRAVAQTVLGDDNERGDDGNRSVASAASSSTGSGTKTVTTYVTKYETKQVSSTVLVTPPEYQTDTDGDGLVDAIDPDPKVRQQEYFTDTDGDSVANAFDRHHGEDDLTYSEVDTDADGNGIIDAYEVR